MATMCLYALAPSGCILDVMRIAVAIYLLVHGICHFVGFVVPWKIVTMKDEPYKTTLLAGNLDVGHVGIRITGILWLLALLGLIASGVGAMARTSWWQGTSFWFAVASLGRCILGLPGARIGIAANLLVLGYALGRRRGCCSASTARTTSTASLRRRFVCASAWPVSCC